MIALLALALQVAAGARPAVLIVRGSGGESIVPLIRTSAGPALRPELMSPALDVSVQAMGDGRYQLSVGGASLSLVDQVPFVRSGAAVWPLAASPFVVDGKLYVPFHLVTDVLPRTIPGLSYDRERAELRLNGATASRPVATPPQLQRPAPPAASADSALTAPIQRASATQSRTVASASAEERGAVRGPRKRHVVVIDAGHGGPDHGMSGPIGGRRRIYEKDITLAVARQLRAQLTARGVHVVMTRTADTLIGLYDRGPIANHNKGDLFISIHVNASNPRWRDAKEARGFETYFLSEARTEDAKRLEEMENDVVRFETGANAPRNDPLSLILNDMAQNEHLRESQALADTIQRALGQVHPSPSRGVKQAGFIVLLTAFMPAVLVEIGFGTNIGEAAYLSDAKAQREIATAIADATVGYLEGYERRVGGPSP
jgi:N-acetylmuramoyl-L-alanine amidase